MSQENKNESSIDEVLRGRVNALIDAGVISQNALAKQIDKSGSYISQWRAGNFADKVSEESIRKFEKVLRGAIEEYERQQSIEETRRARKFRYCKTTVSQAAVRALRAAFENREISVALSHWGVGKTRSVQWYAEQYPNRVLYVRASERMTTKDLVSDLAERCGVVPRGGIYKLRKSITEKLRGQNRLIVIDECEHLSPDAIDEIRQINDDAVVGVCLIGLVKFKSTMTTLRNSKYGYIYDRIKSLKVLPPTNFQDAETLIKSEFKTISKDLCRVIFEAASTVGDDGRVRCSYRRLEALVYKLAEFEAQLTDKLVRQAAEEMEG
jgi:DNA transposition AAA+ family ATPase